MWIFDPEFFVSAVRKPGDPFLTIRARVRADLDKVRAFVPSLSATQVGGGTDYPYRATCTHEAFADGMRQRILEIGYGNFKGETQRVSGRGRASIYHDVWEMHYGMEEKIRGIDGRLQAELQAKRSQRSLFKGVPKHLAPSDEGFVPKDPGVANSGPKRNRRKPR